MKEARRGRKEKENEELAKQKAKEKAKKYHNHKWSGKRPAASRSSKRLEVSSSASNDSSHS